MKRTVLVFLLVNLMLSACAPASAPTPAPVPSTTPLPTATAMPTSTATPTSTPTATPTATPTPIPTIQVGNLSVPDPRVTNPELFDLRNPDAPIPQFADAMQEVGITVDPQTITTELGKNYEIRQGPDGKTYILTTYTVEGKNGARYSMGLIAEQDERGEWRWIITTPVILDNLISPTDFGVLLNDQDYNNPYLSKIATIIWEQPFSRTWIEKHGTNQINKLMRLLQALESKPALYMHPGMWHLDVDSNLKKTSSREDIINYINRMAKYVLC